MGLADLSAFGDPEAVTVVGASADPAKWGYWLARGAAAGAHRRAVHLVNRRGVPIEGRPTVTALADIDGPLGLVVLCVPPADVPAVVHEALDRGAKGFLGITAGLNRALGPNAEAELASTIRAKGARLVGPNCLGIYDASSELQLAWGEFTPGQLGIISQSGQLGSELANLAADRGLGVSRFVSVGNQADVTAAEALADLVDHQDTAVVALYVESFVDGRLMIETLQRLRAAGKHTLLLTVGASDASQTAAASHTGSMTSSLDVVDAACRAAGVLRVDTPAQLIETAQMLVDAPASPGPRTAIVGDSGGQGAIAADVLTRAGLTIAPFAAQQQAALAALLPPDAGVANPVDLAGAGEADLRVYAEIVETLLADDDVDAVTLTGYFGSYGFHTPTLQSVESEVALRIAHASQKHRKPVALHSMCRSSRTIDLVREAGVPTYHHIEDAALALAGGARLASERGRNLAAGDSTPRTAPADGYLAAREVLQSVGVSFPEVCGVTSEAELIAAMRQLPGPWVLKADWIAHKTEVGAVAVGLTTEAAACEALERMLSTVGPGTYVLERMDTRPDVVEVIVGARRDPVFGPVILVGAGGVQAELLRDNALELGPVDTETARQMLQRLRMFPLLTGWRGKPATDIDALAEMVAGVSQLMAAATDCADIEVNPVRVGPTGVLAVDALITTTSTSSVASTTTEAVTSEESR
ncbi:acetate--CoA ligase family protein [Nocardioides sp. SYSU DS0663]|uniref:acetate--CoA ligase family protein n=1 Tax=Nocardioides sp. SYSU DS0663 TaxID=3416445 RepID=UPI003F4BBF8C